MNNYSFNLDNGDYLSHFGIQGMKWGVRRYQNGDGSYNAAGKARYGIGDGKTYASISNKEAISRMDRDQAAYFKSRISKNAAKVTTIGRNGYAQQGTSWGDAYRHGKVTNKDDSQVRKAAKETRAYMKQKYGEKNVKALAQSNELFKSVNSLDIDKSVFVDTAMVKRGAEYAHKISKGNI